jgi:hypothetical protein
VSEALEIRAEILKLARLLDRDPATLAYLADVPADDLRELREQTTERLFTAQGRTLARLAAASKVLPTGLIATISERAFGPLLSAHVAGMLEPARAADVAAKLSPSFLVDVAIEIDPRRASDVIGRIPPRQVADVAAELVQRKEYVAMGQFVGHIGTDALRAALDVMSDRDLLEVAFVLEQKDGLDELVSLLPAERLPAVIETAAQDDLWPQALDLLGHLSDAKLRGLEQQLVERVADLPAAKRRQIAAEAREAGLLDRLGPLREALA